MYICLLTALPQANESALPFEGGLVVRTFAYHMKQVVFRLKGHKCGSAVGALALSAAAVSSPSKFCLISNIHGATTVTCPTG